MKKQGISVLRREFFKATIRGLAACVTALALTSTAQAGHTSPPRLGDVRHPETVFVHPDLASDSTEPVGLRLVALFDASSSVSDAEYIAQLEAMADAVESDEFKNAIFDPAGPGSLGIIFVEFRGKAEVRIGWTDIRKGDEHKFTALANEIRGLKRRGYGGDHHVHALNGAMTALDRAPWAGRRNVVDLMTDGHGDIDEDSDLPPALDKLALQYQATVNVLLTYDKWMLEPDMFGSAEAFNKWAWDNLVTKPGYILEDGTPLDAGFVKGVATDEAEKNAVVLKKFEGELTRAFRRKVLFEVARGPVFDRIQETLLAGLVPDLDNMDSTPSVISPR